MWKVIRIFFLIVILGTVLQQTWLENADLDWKDNFYVALYPVNADDSQEVARYIGSLAKMDFEDVEIFFAEEAERYNLGMRRPIALQLGTTVKRVPPAPPSPNGGNVLKTILWSLQFRYFAWVNSPDVPVKPDIKLYLLFYNPDTHSRLSHSTALNKGRIGRVNLFGGRKYGKRNAVVLSHELLHTLTATDKYDLSTGLPIYPIGFAESDKVPLYPQDFAEIMGAYRPISESERETPQSLNQALVGHLTAREIGWIQ